MKHQVAKRSTNDNLKNDILKIASIAKKAKQSDSMVINATIGTYLNDDKSINQVNDIVEILNQDLTNHLGYPSIRGNQLFKEGLLKWFFKDHYNELIKEYDIPFTATIGGTGAITLAFNLMLDENEKVLLPDIMWSNYQLIATKAGIGYDTYQLLNQNNEFNIDNLCDKIQELAKSQTKVLVVINDPCQNPTGYSLSDAEYIKLIKKLNDLGTMIDLTILFDIAYLEYDQEQNEMHRMFKHLMAEDTTFLTMFAASCSKMFGIYGLRIGALFAVTKDQEFADSFITCIESLIRGTYSCPNGAAIDSLALLLTNDKISSLTKQINENSLTLKKRTNYFINQLNKYHITYLPYHNGFFVCLKVNHAFALCQKLQSLKVYVVPISDDLIRVAVCSLNQDEIDRLITIFQQTIKY